MAINIGQGNFPILSFEQANPYLTGAQAAQNMISTALNQKSLREQIQQAMLANQLQQQIQPSQTQATIAQNLGLAQTAQPMALARLQQLQNINKYYGSTQQSNLDTDKLNRDLLQQRMQYFPLDERLKMQNAMQQSSRFGGAYQLARALSAMAAPAREEWINAHQDQYDQMLADLGNKSSTPPLITPGLLQKYFPDAVIPTQKMNQSAMQRPSVADAGNQRIASSLLSPQNGMNIPMSVPNQFQASTPEQKQKIALASTIAANNALTTMATRRQYEGAQQVEQIFQDPEVKSLVMNASQYAGAAGKGKAAIAALSQKNPKAYEDYLTFSNVTMPLIQSRIKTLDQMGATDSQREILENMYKKTMDKFTSNPAQFMDQFNELSKMLNVIARAVSKSATPLGGYSRLQMNQAATPVERSNGAAWVYDPASGRLVSKRGR